MPSVQGANRLRRKSTNFFRRLSIFVMGILYQRFRKPDVPSLTTTNSILLIAHDPIGDLVLSSALWSTLLKRKPELRIGIAISSRNQEVLSEEKIDKKYDLYSGGIWSIFKEMRRARRDGWDVVLATAGYYKPTRFAFVSRFIANKGVTATRHSSRSKRYSRIYSFCFERPPEWECVPMVQQYCELVEKVFSLKFTPQERLPHFLLQQDADSTIKKKIDQLLQPHGFSRYILLNLEAKVEYREWGIDNVELLAKTLQQGSNDTLIIVTASPEFRQYYTIEERVRNITNIAIIETNSLHELAAVIKYASVVVSPDTSVVHIAAALGKKIVGLYPAHDEWHPYGVEATILYPKRWEPISSISVWSVYSEIVLLLDHTASSSI